MLGLFRGSQIFCVLSAPPTPLRSLIRGRKDPTAVVVGAQTASGGLMPAESVAKGVDRWSDTSVRPQARNIPTGEPNKHDASESTWQPILPRFTEFNFARQGTSQNPRPTTRDRPSNGGDARSSSKREPQPPRYTIYRCTTHLGGRPLPARSRPPTTAARSAANCIDTGPSADRNRVSG